MQRGIVHDFKQLVKKHSRNIIEVYCDIWEDSDGKYRGWLTYSTSQEAKINDSYDDIQKEGYTSYLSFAQIRSDIYQYIKSFKEEMK